MIKDKRIKCIMLMLVLLLGWMGIDAQTSFRILDFNVRMSGQMVNYNVKPFADFIKAHNPDFVVLQEVDYNTERNGKNDFTTQLASELGMFSVFGKAITYLSGEYGVAILSKYPFLVTSNNPLIVSGAKEDRTVLYADVILPSNKQLVRIASTHLDHSTAEVRSSMVSRLNSYIANSIVPTILAGDYNAKPDEDCIVSGMKTLWQRICNNQATYPANPTSKIDYIFGYPNGKWTVKHFEVITNTDISDHCALIADVEYN